MKRKASKDLEETCITPRANKKRKTCGFETPSPSISRAPTLSPSPATHQLRRTSINACIPLLIRLKQNRGAKERPITAPPGEVHSGLLLFGRDKKSVDVALESKTATKLISRKHAKLYYRSKAPPGENGSEEDASGEKEAETSAEREVREGWIVEDTSLNGVFVNGVKRKKWLLQEGDVVTFGGVNGATMKEGDRLVSDGKPEFQYQFKRLDAHMNRANSSAARVAKGLSEEQIERLRSELLMEKEQQIKEKEERLAAAEAEAAKEREIRAAKEKELQEAMERAIKEKEDEIKRKAQEEQERLAAELEELRRKTEAYEAERTELEQVKVECAKWKEEAANRKELEDQHRQLEEELDCVICKDLITVAMTLPCSHSYCAECIDQWSQRNKTCPNCRKPFNKKQLVPSIALDNAIENLVKRLLSEDEQKEREERIQAWRDKQRIVHAFNDITFAETSQAVPAPAPGRAAVIRLDLESDEDDDDYSSSSSSDPSSSSSSSEEEQNVSYGLELARSNRSRCRVCNRFIGNRELRVIRQGTAVDEYYDFTHFYHPECFFRRRWRGQPASAAAYNGFNRLSEGHKATVRTLHENRAR